MAPPKSYRRSRRVHARDAALAAIKHHIEANLESEAATVAELCRHFGLSRASIYRLFEPEGGIARYIQGRRLHRAFLMLASPTGSRERMIDLAVTFQFSSDNTFIRAFHRRFGLTPGAVRRLLGSPARFASGARSYSPLEIAPEAAGWLRQLAAE